MAFQDIPDHIEKMFNSEFAENEALHEFMNKHKLKFVKLLAYGKSAWIVVTRKKWSFKKFTLKVEKKCSTRKDMVEKEYSNLKKANTIGIGQNLIDYDTKARVVMWDYIKGKPLKYWIKTASKKEINYVIKESLKQAWLLDEIGLDHGQLSGDGTNILVTNKNKPMIVDFEKASQKRKCHNYNVLINFFFKESNNISERIKQQI